MSRRSDLAQVRMPTIFGCLTLNSPADHLATLLLKFWYTGYDGAGSLNQRVVQNFEHSGAVFKIYLSSKTLSLSIYSKEATSECARNL